MAEEISDYSISNSTSNISSSGKEENCRGCQAWVGTLNMVLIRCMILGKKITIKHNYSNNYFITL